MEEAAVTDVPVSPSASTSFSSALIPTSKSRFLAKASSASSLEGKKGLHFSPFRLTLPRTKKNKTTPTDDITIMNPAKKVKGEKSFLRSLTSKKSTSALEKVKVKKTTSSIASKLVRKISFGGKTKGLKKVSRSNAQSETSPTTSQEELEEGTAAARGSRPLTPMELDSSEAEAVTTTTVADAAVVDSQVASGVEQAGTATDQWVSIERAADPLLGSPVDRAHLVEAGTGTETSLRAAVDPVGSPSALRNTYVSQHTSKLREAWMSLPGSTSADATGDGAEPTKVPAKSTREQIISITAPAWESQQREKRRREAKAARVKVADGDAEAGTSHSEEYSTPTESPDADAQAAQSTLTQTPKPKAVSAVTTKSTTITQSESGTVSAPTASTATPTPPTTAAPIASSSASSTLATPTLAPSEDILAKPEGRKQPESPLEEAVGSSADATGEDLMAEARARLSQSLGVNTPSASPSVQQGGGGGEKREHLYKILVIGELGTGKTSIIKRYVHQFFSQHYRATIGVDFALKVLNWDANTIIRLQLWDIAGQERFGNMTRVYYKEAVAAFVVFDVTRQATFDAVLKWKQDLDSKVQLPDGSAIPCILLANKCDLQKEGLVNYPGKMDEYCKDRGFAGWFEISAKENINIEDAARLLVTKILANEQAGAQGEVARDGDKLHLGTSASPDESRSKCSC